uniref:Plastid light harvesting protein n=1 Tax=Pseudictyota dubia TaxID=2749911 RepID=A0A7R9W903_9STRA
MKSFAVALAAALAGSAHGFAPASSGSKASSLQMSSMPADYEGMVGIDVETGNKFFDPCGFSNYIPAKWAREAELANGRSAMLASVGWLWPQIFGTFDSTDVTTTDPIKAFSEADPQWWAQFIIFCGTIEAYKYRKGLEGKSSTGGGEPAVDWMRSYPADEEGRRAMELKELKNGRLAMIAVASYFSAHFIPGSVPSLGYDFV